MLNRLRGLWRAARSLPVLRTLLTAVDRFWWARTIRRADVVDADFVSRQLGRAVTERQAIRRYVHGGFRSGLTLNPLFSERLVSAQLPDSDRVPAMYAYLIADQAAIETTLAWDAPAHARSDPSWRKDPGGVLGSAWRGLRAGGAVGLRGGATADLGMLRAAALEPASARPQSTEVPPPGTVLRWRLDAGDADGEGLRGALGVLRDAEPDDVGDAGVGLVLEVAEAPRDVRMLAGLLSLGDARIRVVESEDADPVAPARGAVIVRRIPGAEITGATIQRLAHAARFGPVAPVWISPTGAVSSAGLLVEDGHAYRALRGFPREDAVAVGVELRVAALDSPVAASITGDVRPPRTLLDEAVIGAETDGVPSPAKHPGEVLLDVAPRGLRRAGWITAADGTHPRYAADRGTFVFPDGSSAPRLRWAIKTAAPAGPRGESWGETHFARSLAAALERLGQYVAVDARTALNRPSSEHDDVVLSLRGPHPLPAPGAPHRLLWIISHPDEISADEVAGYDRVVAGSAAWAKDAAERFGTPIEPLLQCTDATRFRPTGAVRGDDLVFVGTARGIARPAVVIPLKAGRRVRVYGPDWRGYIPGSAIAAPHVPNEELPVLYESAGAVLNDHWPAMRREGFISNRLYDVVAAGGRAISDDVEGIDEIFGGAVRTFRNDEELLALTEAPLDDHFAADEELARLSARIRTEHSFDARARQLLNMVLERS